MSDDFDRLCGGLGGQHVDFACQHKLPSDDDGIRIRALASSADQLWGYLTPERISCAGDGCAIFHNPPPILVPELVSNATGFLESIGVPFHLRFHIALYSACLIAIFFAIVVAIILPLIVPLILKLGVSQLASILCSLTLAILVSICAPLGSSVGISLLDSFLGPFPAGNA
jgi:hypothetical protein